MIIPEIINYKKSSDIQIMIKTDDDRQMTISVYEKDLTTNRYGGIFKEQDKSSDIEQQPPSATANKAIHSLKIGRGTKPTETSYM